MVDALRTSEGKRCSRNSSPSVSLSACVLTLELFPGQGKAWPFSALTPHPTLLPSHSMHGWQERLWAWLGTTAAPRRTGGLEESFNKASDSGIIDAGTIHN